VWESGTQKTSWGWNRPSSRIPFSCLRFSADDLQDPAAARDGNRVGPRRGRRRPVDLEGPAERAGAAQTNGQQVGSLT